MPAIRIFVDLAMPPDAVALLRQGAQDCELLFPAKPITSVLVKAEADPQFALADVAFGQPDLDAIAGAPRLKWVHVSSSGITRYDTPEFRAYAAGRGLMLSNSALVYQEGCALHVLSFMLAQARCLPAALGNEAANGSEEWIGLRGACRDFRGQRALILGYGAIGRRLAEMLGPLGLNISAYRRQPRGDEGIPVIAEQDLAAALAVADHVINILPESAATRRFFDDARFGALKRNAVFYNIGRGATVDQDALLRALRSGRLSAAWLDVTEPEPLPSDHPLRLEPSCHITPHIAGGHRDETHTLVRHFLANLERYRAGAPLLDRVL